MDLVLGPCDFVAYAFSTSTFFTMSDDEQDLDLESDVSFSFYFYFLGSPLSLARFAGKRAESASPVISGFCFQSQLRLRIGGLCHFAFASIAAQGVPL